MRDYNPVIRKEDLVHGTYYEGRCRNATQARWNAARQVFVHWRFKFGSMFLEEIRCPEDDQHFDVFIAMRAIPPGEEERHIDI